MRSPYARSPGKVVYRTYIKVDGMEYISEGEERVDDFMNIDRSNRESLNMTGLVRLEIMALESVQTVRLAYRKAGQAKS